MRPDLQSRANNARLKCDRQQPCKTCVDRGLSLSCTYNRNHPAPPPTADAKAPHNVHDRIDQLEKLVTSLMGAKNGDHAPGDVTSPPAFSNHSYTSVHSDESQDTEIPGNPDRVKLDSDATSYTNSGHWTSILDGVSFSTMDTHASQGSQRACDAW